MMLLPKVEGTRTKSEAEDEMEFGHVEQPFKGSKANPMTPMMEGPFEEADQKPTWTRREWLSLDLSSTVSDVIPSTNVGCTGYTAPGWRHQQAYEVTRTSDIDRTLNLV